ncbi:MAG: protein kinase [Planctomycetota bacterium]
MMSNDERILKLVDEFLLRSQNGDAPSIDEYCQQQPDLADEIRELFPTLVIMEDLQVDEFEPAPVEEHLPEAIGDYQIIAEIGRGGMGVVYEAEQQSLGRRVALKVLPDTFRNNESARIRFQREARAAARMHHTNIVPVFEVGEDRESFFYAMQLIQGQGLDQVIEELSREGSEGESRRLHLTRTSTNALSQSSYNVTSDSSSSMVRARVPESSTSDKSDFYRSVARIGIQSSDALSYAHNRGVIHRDIKPSNLLLDRDGIVWITDFGLAKTEDADGLTHTGDYVGTLRYMSPERFRESCDPRADVYALGVTLYELLLQRPLHDAGDRLKLIYKINEVPPVMPRQVDPDVPRDLETIVLKAIEKEVETRYQTANDLAQDLLRFLNDEPILARRVSSFEQLTRWSRRNRGLAAALAGIAFLLVVVGFGGAAMGLVQMQLRVRTDDALQTAENRRREATAARDISEQAQREAVEARHQTEIALSAMGEARSQEARALEATEQQRKQNVRTLYFSQMRRISELVDLPGARRTIRETVNRWSDASEVEGLKRWEWDFARAVSRQDGLLLPDTEDAFSADWSSDGGTIVVGGENRLRFYDSISGELKDSAARHDAEISCVRCQPNGKLIATTSDDGLVTLWDNETKEKIKSYGPFDKSGWITCVWSQSGTKLASFQHGRGLSVINLDDLDSDPLHIRVPDKRFEYLSFSPDETVVAAGIWFDNEVHIYDLRTGLRTQVFPDENGRPNATRIIWGNNHDVSKILHTTSSGRIDLYDGGSHERIRSYYGHSRWAARLDVVDGGNVFASGSVDRTAKIWDWKTGRIVRSFAEHKSHIDSVRLSPDGRRVVTTSADGVRVWNRQRQTRIELATSADSRPLRQFRERRVVSTRWHPDGNLLATARYDGKCRIWDVTRQKRIKEFDCLGYTVSWSHDGSRLAITSNTNSVVYHLDSDQTDELPEELRLAAWHGHENMLAVRGPGVVAPLRILKWNEEETGFEDSVESNETFTIDSFHSAFCWSPNDTRFAIVSPSARVLIIRDGEIEKEFAGGLAGKVNQLAWSPDGQYIAAACDDETIRIWDVDLETSEVAVLDGHSNPVTAVDWNRDGSRLASGSTDGTIRMWESSDWKETFFQKTDSSGITTLDWSSDGKRLAVGDLSGNLVVFQTDLKTFPPVLVPAQESPPSKEPIVAREMSVAAEVLLPGKWEWREMERLPDGVNTEYNEYEPFVSNDELTLLFSSDRPGTLGEYDLFVSERTTTNDAWPEPTPLASINTQHDEQSPHLSTDGLTLWFHSNRGGAPEIYVTTRESRNAPWASPTRLPDRINTGNVSAEPTISQDGLTMVFLSSLNPHHGIFDLWMSVRNSVDDPWGEPLHMNKQVNAETWQGAPEIFGDEFGSTLVFHSARGIKVASRTSRNEPFLWAEAFDENNELGGAYSPFALNDGKTLYFRRSDPTDGTFDIWVARRNEKPLVVEPLE